MVYNATGFVGLCLSVHKTLKKKKWKKRQYLWISQERMKRTFLSTFIYFFFLNMTFPLTLIKVSLNPKFGKLLIEENLLTGHILLQAAKRITVINVSPT